MFVRVRTPKSSRKNVVRLGGEVTLRAMPGKTPLSRVDRSTPPALVAVRRVNGHKMATIGYTDSVDGDTHLVEVSPSALLQGAGTELNIGDRVELIAAAPSVCVSVGSRGTVVGGSGVYTVSFEMTHSGSGEELKHVVTVTQDQVPRGVLRFEGEAPEDEGDVSEESSDSDMDMEELVGGDDRGVMASLTRALAPRVLEEVVLMLNLDELDELSARLPEDSAELDVDSVMALMLD